MESHAITISERRGVVSHKKRGSLPKVQSSPQLSGQSNFHREISISHVNLAVPDPSWQKKFYTWCKEMFTSFQENVFFKDLKWWQRTLQLIFTALATYGTGSQTQSSIAALADNSVAYGFSIGIGFLAGGGALYASLKLSAITISSFTQLVDRVEWFGFNAKAQEKKLDEEIKKNKRLLDILKKHDKDIWILQQQNVAVKRKLDELTVDQQLMSQRMDKQELRDDDYPGFEEEDEPLALEEAMNTAPSKPEEKKSSYTGKLRMFCYNVYHFCLFSCEPKPESTIQGQKSSSAQALSVTAAAPTIQNEMKVIELEDKPRENICTKLCSWSIFSSASRSSKTAEIIAHNNNVPSPPVPPAQGGTYVLNSRVSITESSIVGTGSPKDGSDELDFDYHSPRHLVIH